MNNYVYLTRIEAGFCSHDELHYNTKYVASKCSGTQVHTLSKPNVSDNQNRYKRMREREREREGEREKEIYIYTYREKH